MLSSSLLEEIARMRPEVSRGRETDQIDFTGERFLPGYTDGSIELEHLHRYSVIIPYIVRKSVLDIACGEGYGSHLMAHVASQVTGVDADEKAIELARSRYDRPNLLFKSGSASEIPLEDGSVDVVVSFETLEHLVDHAGFWAEVQRVLNPSGIIFISSPNRESYNQNRDEKNPFHLRELSRQELVNELSSRFANHELFSQMSVFGSLITPSTGKAVPYTQISIQPEIGVLAWKTGDDVQQPYSIAVASDGPLPELGQTLFTGYYPPNALASLVGGIAERDRLIRELKRELAPSKTITPEALNDGSSTSGYERGEEWTVLKRERDQALLQANRLRETLGEQDRTIRALKGLMGEYARRSPSDKQTGLGYESVQESTFR